MFCNILCIVACYMYFYLYIYIYIWHCGFEMIGRSGSKVCTSKRAFSTENGWNSGKRRTCEKNRHWMFASFWPCFQYCRHGCFNQLQSTWRYHDVLNGSTVLYCMRCSLFEGLVTLKISLDSEFPFWPLYVLLRWPIIKRLWAVCPCLPHPNSSWDRWTRNEWEVFIVSTSLWGIVTCQGIHIAPRSKRFRGYLAGGKLLRFVKRDTSWLISFLSGSLCIWKANWKICGNDGQWWTFDCFEPTALWL